MAETKLPPGCLSTDLKGLRQDIIQSFPGLKALFKGLGLVRKTFIRKGLQGRLQSIDLIYQRLESLQLPFIFAAKDEIQQTDNHKPLEMARS